MSELPSLAGPVPGVVYDGKMPKINPTAKKDVGDDRKALGELCSLLTKCSQGERI